MPDFVDIAVSRVGGLPAPAGGEAARLSTDGQSVYVGLPSGIVVPIGLASGEKRDLFNQRAQAIVNGPFGTLGSDFFGAATDMGNGGFAPTSSMAQVTSGRGAGGSRSLITLGANGQFFMALNSQLTLGTSSATFVSIPDLAADAWYMEAIVNIVTMTGNVEFMPVMSWNAPVGNPAATDAGSPYMMIMEVNGGVSSTNWVVKSSNTTALTFTTSIPIELGTTRHVGLGHDGWGTLYTVLDGVIKDKFQMFNNVPHVVGTVGFSGRGLAGTLTAQLDRYDIGGPYL